MLDQRSVTGSVASPSRWARAELVKARWRAGEPPDAAAALAADPDLGADKQVVLDLAYDEFSLREETGQAVSPDSFAGRFPAYRSSLRRLLSVHRFLAASPDVLDAPPMRWPAPGDSLAEFEIVRELGRGGFARVYLAREETAGGRGVVLKASAGDLGEANTLGPLTHPHVVRVLAARRIGELAVVVLPFEGYATLEDVLSAVWRGSNARVPARAADLLTACRGGRLDGDPPLPEAPPYPIRPEDPFPAGVAAVAAGLADALAFLHDRGLAHTDLKPSNVLLAPSGFPYLLDFNLAERARTSPESVGGTIPYMAPEQLAAFCSGGASRDYDRRSADVFALGVILYELLTGRHPFPVSDLPADVVQYADSHRRGCRPLRSLNPAVRREIASLVERCLSLDPAARPAAGEIATAFRRVRDARPRRRSRAVLAVAAALAGLGGIAAARFTLDDPPAPTTDAPPSPPGPMERGRMLLDQGLPGLAAAEFVTAANDEAGGRAYAHAAYCSALSGDHLGAIVYSDKAIERGEATAVVLNNRAFSCFQRAQYGDSLRNCDAAVAADPGCLEARFQRMLIAIRGYQLRDSRLCSPMALADAEYVRTHGPPSPLVSELAAQLRVLSAPTDPAALDWAAAAVREAVERGADPVHVARNPDLAPIADHPVYRTALKTQPGPRRAELRRLIRPPF
jgi:serine/threonine protein kinase